jgi:hypothetical protein
MIDQFSVCCCERLIGGWDENFFAASNAFTKYPTQSDIPHVDDGGRKIGIG